MKTRSISLTRGRAFTLVELLVSVSVLALLMFVLISMTNQITQTWRSTTGKIEQFQEARDGFESMTRKISQATLNTFWDLAYEDVDGRKAPVDFIRQSQLRFICGPMAELAPPSAQRPTHGIFFQAPLGFVDDVRDLGQMENLLNTWGYYLEVVDDTDLRPPFLSGRVPARTRCRLMELMQPTEKMSVYDLDQKGEENPVSGDQLGWFKKALTGSNPPVRVVADNIIALVIWPRLSKQQEDARRDAGRSVLSPEYFYDSALLSFASPNPGSDSTAVYLNKGTSGVDVVESNPKIAGEISPKNQLPPLVQVTMVALDEVSAQRLVAKSGVNAMADLTNGLFKVACRTGTRANDETQYDEDIRKLEENLVNERLTYRVFTATVSIRGAKWSSYQSK